MANQKREAAPALTMQRAGHRVASGFFFVFFLVGFKRVHFLFFLRVASDFQVRADRRESSTFLVEPRRKKERERERRKREKEETMERGGFD